MIHQSNIQSTTTVTITDTALVTHTEGRKTKINMAWWQAGQAPPYPPERAYKPFYCEENAYQLAAALAPPAASHNAHSIREVRLSRNSQDLYRAIWDAFVLVISNATKSVALWQQRASKLPESGHAVVWDYHVVFLLTCNLVPLSSPANKKPSPTTSPPPTPPPPRTWVYDRDSLLADEQPIPFSTYITQTFGPARQLPNHLRATFRLVPANEFLDTFASDRSHMRRKDGTWSAAPPEWPLIIGPQASSTNNLMAEFVDMSANRIGRVLADKHFFTTTGHVSQSRENPYSDAPAMPLVPCSSTVHSPLPHCTHQQLQQRLAFRPHVHRRLPRCHTGCSNARIAHPTCLAVEAASLHPSSQPIWPEQPSSVPGSDASD